MRPLSILVAPAATLLFFQACDSSTTGATAPDSGLPTVDSGLLPDGAVLTDGEMTDAPDGAVSTGPVTSCDAAVRLDTLRGVNGSTTMSAASYGDKWVATWFQIASASPDKKDHFKARSFDGTTLAAEIDLGEDAYVLQHPFATDGLGHAFVDRFVNPASERRIYDFATGTFGAGTPFAAPNSSYDLVATAGIPNVGALSAFRSGTSVTADKWTNTVPSWTATGLAAAKTNADEIRTAVAANGRAAVAFRAPDGSGGTDLVVVAYDGAAWASPVTKNVPAASGGVGHIALAIHSNGDPLLVWTQGFDVLSGRLRVATNTFDANVPVETGKADAIDGPSVVVDGGDRVTIAWARAAHVFARRDIGAGLLPTQDVGAGDSYRLDLDGTTSAVTLLTYKLPTLSLQRVAATSPSFAPLLPLNMGISNVTLPRRQSAVVFDATGRPTVITMQDAAGAGGLELFYAKCN